MAGRGPMRGSGLPVGVQIVAPPWREDLLLLLLQVAHTLDLAHTWIDRHPNHEALQKQAT